MGNAVSEMFENVSVATKANIYFDGKVTSHAVFFADGSKKTLGIVYPGAYNFNVGQAERMEIVAGECRVKLAGADDWTAYGPGTTFEIPANSSFDIAVDGGVLEYVCSYL